MIRTLLVLLAVLPSASALAAEWPDLSKDAAPQGHGENDAAVVVGIERYAFVAGINGAAQNAADWHSFLTRTRKVPLSQVRLLRDAEGSLEQLRSEAQWAAKTVKPGGTVWFVFIGHGAPSRDGKDGILVGVDAQQRADSLFARSLSQRELLQILSTGRQARSVVLLDACFSGRSSSGQELVRGLQPLIPVSRATSVAKALVFTAGKADQFAGPLPGADRPAFSYLMLGALRGWADANRDGKVSAEEAVQYARGALLALVKDRSQTPELIGTPTDPLASGASELGPDLGELVRATLPPVARSEVSFGGGVQFNVPKIKVTSASGSLKSINIKAEQLLEEALDKEEQPNARPGEKSAGWCALAAVADRNPYRQQAQKGCAEWKKYAETLGKLEKNLTQDYSTLAAYLALRRKTPEQKASAAEAFLSTYGGFKDQPLVAAVSDAAAATKQGKDWFLPEAKSAAEDVKQTSEAFGPCDGAVQCLQQKECRSGKLKECLAFGNAVGSGDKPNPARAAAIYGHACEKGLTTGCSYRASLYLYGVLKDPAKAVPLLEKACEQKDPASCTGLSNLHQSGEGGLTKDLPKARDYALRACELDPVQCALVPSFYLGVYPDLPRDTEKAIALYQRACDAKNDAACTAVARQQEKQRKDAEKLAETDRLTAAARDDLDRGLRHCPSDATCKLIKELCDSDPKQCSTLGGMFEVGSHGLPKNSAAGYLLRKKACDAGDPNACFMVGSALHQGNGVRVDLAAAILLYRRSCDAGIAVGCHSMKYGNRQDREDGEKRLKELCEKKDASACTYWGIR